MVSDGNHCAQYEQRKKEIKAARKRIAELTEEVNVLKKARTQQDLERGFQENHKVLLATFIHTIIFYTQFLIVHRNGLQLQKHKEVAS